MYILIPILGAILQASSLTLDKIILSIRKIDYKTYAGVSYPLVFLITLIVFVIFRAPLTPALFAGNLFWLILLSILLTALSNIFFYRALDNDGLGEIQTITLLHFIPIIIFSGVFFADERNILITILALFASLAVVWSHWEKHHFKLKKTSLLYLAWSLTAIPLGALIAKVILYTWNPISFQLIYSGGVALILGPLYFKSTKNIPAKAWKLLLLTNLISSIAGILFYLSYQNLGVVYTSLIFCLQPLLVYFASLYILKEKFYWKKTIAFLVILLAIVLAQIFK